jgi:hypothetical protein
MPREGVVIIVDEKVSGLMKCDDIRHRQLGDSVYIYKHDVKWSLLFRNFKHITKWFTSKISYDHTSYEIACQ